MNFNYDPKVDAACIKLTSEKVVRTDEVRPGIMIDLDEEDRVVGIEVLSVSKREKSAAAKAKPLAR